MITSSAVPLSGMRLSQSALRSTAHNTANLETDAFSKQRSRGVAVPSGGVRTVVDRLPVPAEDQTLADILPGPQNIVRLAEEAVNRISALRRFEVNANVVRTQDQLAKSLLDLTA